MCVLEPKQPMGTGIGTSRSLISGVIANGPKCLLIREVLDETWEVQFSHPGTCCLDAWDGAYIASQSSAGVGTPPPLLPSPRDYPYTQACLPWGPYGWWAFTSWWARLFAAWSSTKLSSKSLSPTGPRCQPPWGCQLVCLCWISQM